MTEEEVGSVQRGSVSPSAQAQIGERFQEGTWSCRCYECRRAQWHQCPHDQCDDEKCAVVELPSDWAMGR